MTGRARRRLGLTLAAAATALAPAAARGQGAGLDAIAVSRAVAADPQLGRTLRAVAPAARATRFILVNLNARRLWYLDGDTIRFVGPVAVGRGTPRRAGARLGRHATPRARFTVLRKDTLPVWVPPAWYFEEIAASTGRPLRHLAPRDTVRARDGSAVYYVDGGEVVRRAPTGEVERVALTDSAGMRVELVVDGSIVVPPVGATQRQYPHVLGPRRLAFRDGYAIHGTDDPESIGRAASHGCLRLHNVDMLALFELVAVGTPVLVR